MKFKDFFDIAHVEVKQILQEGWAKPITLSDGKKSTVHLSLNDVKSVPTKFKMYFIFTIQFNSASIRQKFEQEKNKDIQLQIKKSMSSKPTNMVSIEPKFVDYKKFYLDVMRNELSSEKIQTILNKFAAAGTFNLQDFSITKIQYPLIGGAKINDIILWKQFIGKDKKNSKASPIKLQFGYSAEFLANNKLKMYSKTDIINLAKSFVPEFEHAVLKDTDYFEFAKPATTSVKEQNIYNMPLSIWKAGDSDVALYNEQSLFDIPATKPDDASKSSLPAGGAVLKGDTGKKIAGRIMSAINFAIGRFSSRELKPGKTLSGIPELIRVVKHAYQLPPEQELPAEFIRPNIERWLNMHDPAVDEIPIQRMEDGRLQILKSDDIKNMQKERQRQKALQGTQVTAGATY